MSALENVITALSTLLTGTVFDGPRPTADYPETFTLIGSTGDPDEEAATTEREWSPMANRWIRESGDIECVVISWSGDTDVVARRLAAVAQFEAHTASILADPTLGGLLDPGEEPLMVTGTRLFQSQTSAGVEVRMVFTVRFHALLT